MIVNCTTKKPKKSKKDSLTPHQRMQIFTKVKEMFDQAGFRCKKIDERVFCACGEDADSAMTPGADNDHYHIEMNPTTLALIRTFKGRQVAHCFLSVAIERGGTVRVDAITGQSKEECEFCDSQKARIEDEISSLYFGPIDDFLDWV